MKDEKPNFTLFVVYFMLSTEIFVVVDVQKRYMECVSYASTIDNLMYTTVCTCPDLAPTVSIVGRYMATLGKQRWDDVKWILRYLCDTTYRIFSLPNYLDDILHCLK